MADNRSVLDFDDIAPVQVRLGGRNFEIRPQSASIVQKVLEYSSVDTDRPIGVDDGAPEKTGGRDPRQFVRDVFSTWGDTVAATALMLGLEPGAEDYAEGIAHLEKHLRPAVVIKVYETWWSVNEIGDFLSQSGRVLMPVDTVQRLKEIRARTADQLMDLMAETAAEELAEPTPPS